MTDGLNVICSNDRAAPINTNPKNLELAPPQFVTDTRLDQLVYSQNCSIQIFQTQLFSRSEDRTPNRSKLKSNALPIELYIYIYIATLLTMAVRRKLQIYG